MNVTRQPAACQKPYDDVKLQIFCAALQGILANPQPGSGSHSGDVSNALDYTREALKALEADNQERDT